ncbi:hypothetical protein C7N83_08390 [Neisseria iguanae]|uniref:Uncharacterized protein n=1 Tax=Neisseria iguanae TaxID=90242 RepID=A0A2P7TZD8_9NEIS|nr:hypothetical protein C7N83_08390 [Neisseria iguanae]
MSLTPVHKVLEIGASGNSIAFGILKRNGVVCTGIAPNAPTAPLIKVIRGHIIYVDGEIDTGGRKPYDNLVNMG